MYTREGIMRGAFLTGCFLASVAVFMPRLPLASRMGIGYGSVMCFASAIRARLVTAEGVSCEKKSGPGLGNVRVCTSGENPHQTQIETLEDNAELAVQEGGQQS